ncbi:MAG TPA: ArsC/Spx/MgsR family protein [Gillisia sp.]|nr:ArsC/Spx/MgsR family protein [Gillisia sp.]
MKKIYHLSSCSTCKRILNELEPSSAYILQEIKQDPLTEEQVDEMYELAGSYESLFSKRAQLYKERDLKDKIFEDEDYKNLILEHYTFLKRPVVINNDKIFIGNSKSTVEAAKKAMNE